MIYPKFFLIILLLPILHSDIFCPTKRSQNKGAYKISRLIKLIVQIRGVGQCHMEEKQCPHT